MLYTVPCHTTDSTPLQTDGKYEPENLLPFANPVAAGTGKTSTDIPLKSIKCYRICKIRAKLHNSAKEVTFLSRNH